ncbi:MAG TPA: SET domain-containing protein [Bacteroidia bacterium]|nr:SET domain-containing protein [Bacteroidia bacterium]
MIHPNTEVRFINDKIGYGVVATQLIPKGTITWALDKLDRIFSVKEMNAMKDPYRTILDTYSYRNNKGEFILCWDNARFVNHSFNSNCITTAYEFEIAVRDILPGEQLTDDYGYLNVSEPFDCIPEKGSLRTRVMPDDILTNYTVWDKKLADAFKKFSKVEQPLANLLDAKILSKAQSIAKGETKMASILTCHYKGNGLAKHAK